MQTSIATSVYNTNTINTNKILSSLEKLPNYNNID